jgi:uncharacterized integral membrane protein (TIGR00698 family)
MSTALSLRTWPEQARTLFPGVLACAVVAAAATFLSQHYGGPVMLWALLLGTAMNFLTDEGGRCLPGIEFSTRTLLRLGVALLGLRITTAQIAELGFGPLLLVVVCVTLTIAVSMLAARWLGFQSLFGLLSGGAVAICGASAALALAAALPAHPQKERATLFTVVSVSALSTLAMIVYPMIAQALGLDPRAAGIFLGATIHDVAQVVGAGYAMSQHTGDIATFVKLLRVAMLLPVIVVAVLLSRRQAGAAGDAGAGPRPPLLPWFAVAFALLVGIHSLDVLPKAVVAFGNDASRAFLVAAIAAIGMKTRLKELLSVGFKPVALVLGETAFLAVLAWVLLKTLVA